MIDHDSQLFIIIIMIDHDSQLFIVILMNMMIHNDSYDSYDS